MIVAHLNNNQSKKKAWMREAQWMWHLIHNDPFADTSPVFGILETQFAGMQTSFGVTNFDNAQGPPV
jgi:hypothetical protein